MSILSLKRIDDAKASVVVLNNVWRAVLVVGSALLAFATRALLIGPGPNPIPHQILVFILIVISHTLVTSALSGTAGWSPVASEGVTPGLWVARSLLFSIVAYATGALRPNTPWMLRLASVAIAIAAFTHAIFLGHPSIFPTLSYVTCLFMLRAWMSYSSGSPRMRDLIVAGAAGTTWLVLLITALWSRERTSLIFGSAPAAPIHSTDGPQIAPGTSAVAADAPTPDVYADCEGKGATCITSRKNACRASFCINPPGAVRMKYARGDVVDTETLTSDQAELRTSTMCIDHVRTLKQALQATNPTAAQRYCINVHSHDDCIAACKQHLPAELTEDDISSMQKRVSSFSDGLLADKDDVFLQKLRAKL